MIDRDRVAHVVLGLAVGDALSWPAARHRARLLPERRIQRLRVLEAFADEHRSTTRPAPHVHASSPAVLEPRPSDDLEWFVFSARAQLAALDGAAVADAWLDLARRGGAVQARTGTQIALANLVAGRRPPHSGHDNPHYFDDIACVRAVAAGLLHWHDDDAAAGAAAADAAVTHALDGLWCAEATAVLVARLVRGEPAETAIEACLARLPEGTWSDRTARLALSLAEPGEPPLQVALRLQARVVDRIYSYGVSAPETLALLLAHLRVGAGATELMLGAFAHGRNADALPALAGAVAGLIGGLDWIPRELTQPEPTLDGVCLPELAGMPVAATIDRLAVAARLTGRSDAR